jgi:hypothetical protein
MSIREVGFPQTHYYGGKLRNAITIAQPAGKKEEHPVALLSFLAHGEEYPLPYNYSFPVYRTCERMGRNDSHWTIYRLDEFAFFQVAN